MEVQHGCRIVFLACNIRPGFGAINWQVKLVTTGFRYQVMPEVFVDESFDVATACSLEEAVRFPGVAVQPRLRTQEYLIRFAELEKGIDVETSGNCYRGVAPFGDQRRFGPRNMRICRLRQ